ncbi:hypothetical protein LTS18_012486 [Coniosporium uncinatum]|uniref:Uncharacterized protein n=1 Tax=Coniosporium uncinatum TaxID=93489 RepID=A0ACC3DIZ4_9PEZI|nr:hypothetical protein LTS18_012486 [Coniosporium uncinatum]
MLADVGWSQMGLVIGVVGKRMAVTEELSDQLVDKERKTAVETLLAWKAIVATFRKGWREKFEVSGGIAK